MASGEHEDENENTRRTNMTSGDMSDKEWNDQDPLPSMAGAVLGGAEDDDVAAAAGRILADPEHQSSSLQGEDDADLVQEAWESMEKSPRAEARQAKEDAERDELWDEFCAEDNDDWDDDDY